MIDKDALKYNIYDDLDYMVYDFVRDGYNPSIAKIITYEASVGFIEEVYEEQMVQMREEYGDDAVDLWLEEITYEWLEDYDDGDTLDTE